ncbi:uncharacterized protein MONOS_16871 [Monocercomonoides exilis]|uniref:uncharacterized protein n=1 Tax=Monocercomonoides exilis TaxID=2049356 RepID=UPI003559371A|nr:hypothetical protein MONOS_16871 [Monocercomonoides exilis]
MTKTEQFSKLLREMEECGEDEQKQKIEEMKELINEMNTDDFRHVFTKEQFNKFEKMIEEKKISLENAALLLKHVGYCKKLKNIWIDGLKESLLNKRLELIIIAEDEKKKDEKNENLLIDLCECYISLSRGFPPELLSICVPHLLKKALMKGKNEEIQKEVEIVLLALSNIDHYGVNQALYLDEIKEIIQHHQEHHNLTQLAYQSAWLFLSYRLFFNDKSFKEVVANELHFVREAKRELVELTRQVDWMKKEENRGKKEEKELYIFFGWFSSIGNFLINCDLWNEEFAGLICSITRLLRVAKDNYRDIRRWFISILKTAAQKGAAKVDDLLKGGAVEAVLEEILQPAIDGMTEEDCFIFFLNISERLNEKEEDEKEEEERKAAKMEIFEKLEKEGYEDAIFSFHEKLPKAVFHPSFMFVPKNLSDYLMHL